MKNSKCSCFGREVDKDVGILYQSTIEPNNQPTWARFVAGFVPVVDEDDPCISFKDEALTKSRNRQNLPVCIRVKWRKAAIWATVICIIVSIAFSLASFAASAGYHSDSALVLAFDCFLAIFNSLVVLWRFRVEKTLGPRRERICCIAFGASFVLAGMVTCGMSVAHIEAKERAQKTASLTAVLTSSCITYIVLAVIQFRIAEKLRSSAMLASSIDSFISGILIFGLLISNLVYNAVEVDLWYLDHAMGICAGVVTMLCGGKILVDVLVYGKLPIEAIDYEFM